MSLEAGVSEASAQAVLTIDLGALVANWRLLREKIGAADCAAVVKANAYGVGLEPAARALARAGCRTFFVAHASEGERLRRELGEDSPQAIYALNGVTPGHARAFIKHDLRPVLSSLEQIREWRDLSLAQGVGLPAALLFDTGMNRLGLSIEAIAEVKALISDAPRAPANEPPRGGNVVSLALATRPATMVAARRKLAASTANAPPPGVHVDLVMGHFVSSEVAEDARNWRQMAAFRRIAHEFPDVCASLANSSGIFLPQHPFHDLARPGYALYGGNPTPGRDNPMSPVVFLKAPVLQLRDIAPGDTVGYNGQWTAKRPTRLATIGVGYADGLFRSLGGTDARPGGEAMVLGRRCPYVGRVSMDLTVLDVTDVTDPALAPGTMVELLGETIGVDEMGARAGTIGYEVLTSLGPRYHRDYVGGSAASARMPDGLLPSP